MLHTHIQYLYLLQKTHDSHSSYASTCFDSKNVEQVSHILADPVTDPPFSQCYVSVLYTAVLERDCYWCSGDAYFYIRDIALWSWIEWVVVIDNRCYLLGPGRFCTFIEIFSPSILSISTGQTWRRLSPITAYISFSTTVS